MSIPEILADCCRNYYQTIMTMNNPPRPSSREDYKQLLRDGYLSHSQYHGRQAGQYINMATGATWGELDRAATDFAGNLGNGLGALGESGRLGARDFLGLCWLTGDLDRCIGGRGIGENPPRPQIATGFRRIDGGDRHRAHVKAGGWASSARYYIGRERYQDVHANVRNYYTAQVIYALRLYRAALRGDPMPVSFRDAYYQALRDNPTDIWSSYKLILYPAMRQTGHRLAYSVLVGYDPYSGGRPPASAAESLFTTFLDGLN